MLRYTCPPLRTAHCVTRLLVQVSQCMDLNPRKTQGSPHSAAAWSQTLDLLWTPHDASSKEPGGIFAKQPGCLLRSVHPRLVIAVVDLGFRLAPGLAKEAMACVVGPAAVDLAAWPTQACPSMPNAPLKNHHVHVLCQEDASGSGRNMSDMSCSSQNRAGQMSLRPNTPKCCYFH